MILGTISSVDSSNGLKLIIDGEDDPTTKKYTYVSSYVPAANDRVLIEEIGGSYVIIGKVIKDYNSSGVARTAETATSAVNATNATTADSCTGNAATATTASACSGNAATATVSDKTKGFDTMVNSASGSLVTYVTKEYISSLSKYVVTDVQITSPQNFTYK